MRRVLAIFLAAAMLIAPAQAQTLPADPQAALDAFMLGPPPSAPSTAGEPANSPEDNTVLGMSYGKAAAIGAGVVAGAVLINSAFGTNLGTLLGVLYVGHLVVEAVLVASGAGAAWGFGWFGEDPAEAL